MISQTLTCHDLTYSAFCKPKWGKNMKFKSYYTLPLVDSCLLILGEVYKQAECLQKIIVYFSPLPIRNEKINKHKEHTDMPTIILEV